MEAQVETMEPEPESDALAGFNAMWGDFMDRVTATLCPSMYVKKQANGRRPTDKRSGAELATYIKAHPTAAEVVGENYGQATTRPFFDQDVFIPNSELPEDPAEREAHLRDLVATKNRTAIDLLLRWFEGEVKEEDIAIAERCGEKTKLIQGVITEGFAISFHYVLPRKKVEYVKLRDLAQSSGGVFDTAVYKKAEQMWACLCTVKGRTTLTAKDGSKHTYDDTRVMRAITHPRRLCDHYVSILDGNETELRIPCVKPLSEALVSHTGGALRAETVSEIEQAMKHSLMHNFTDHSVAEVLKRMLEESGCRIVSTMEGSKELWFQVLQCGRWQQLSSRAELVNYLAEKVCPAFEAFLTAQQNSQPDFKALQAIRSKCENSGPKKAVIDEYRSLVMDGDLLQKMDVKSPHLLGFEDGVYDFHLMEFRNAEPSEYVSFSCGYEFPRGTDNEVRRELLLILLGMFTTEEEFEALKEEPLECELVKYVLTEIARVMCGSNARLIHMFSAWLGNGRNGKGLLVDLMKQVLGQYVYTLQPSYFTQASGRSRESTPELVGLRGARFVPVPEPEATEAASNNFGQSSKLKTDKFKAMTGGDEIPYRANNQDQQMLLPQFGLFLLCNSVPVPDNVSDTAFTERMSVTPFPIRFRDNPNGKHEKKADSRLRKKLEQPLYRDAMLLLLIEVYSSEIVPLLASGAAKLKCPQAVIEAAARYEAESKPIANWFLQEYVIDHPAMFDGSIVENNKAIVFWRPRRSFIQAYKDQMRDEGEQSNVTGNQFWSEVKTVLPSVPPQLQKREGKRGVMGLFGVWPRESFEQLLASREEQ